MAELHTNVYIKHHDKDLHTKLAGVFKTINDTPRPDYEKIEENLLNDAIAVSPDNGRELVGRLLSSVKESHGSPSEDLVAESRDQVSGYHSLHFVHGGTGMDIIGVILQFLAELTPEVDVRACLAGDDDPWEIFYRLENGEIVSKSYEPDYDEAEEDELPDIYLWWHDGLPVEIKDGFINEWKEEEEDEEDDD